MRGQRLKGSLQIEAYRRLFQGLHLEMHPNASVRPRLHFSPLLQVAPLHKQLDFMRGIREATST